ncbi:MAG: aminotransferase class IV [Bacteroidota bacterium]
MTPPSSLQFIESIALDNGQMQLLSFHQKRVNRARRQLLGIKQQLNLRTYLDQQVLPATGYHKVRIVYGKDVTHFSCQPYTQKVRKSLRIVPVDAFDYRHKYLDRKALDTAFTYRDGCDGILMSRQSFLMDTYYGNIALYDGRKWWTPAHPLLKGVRRAALIQAKQLHPTVLRVPDLQHFRELRIINALIPLEESPSIPVERIYLPGEAMGD